MRETIKQMAKNWDIPDCEPIQRYAAVWELQNRYMLKLYKNRKQLKQNAEILILLRENGITVPEIISTRSGEPYAATEELFGLMTAKLNGENPSDIRDPALAYQMGQVIGQLHLAFQKMESQLNLRENSLLSELDGWILRTLHEDRWTLISEAEYLDTRHRLKNLYSDLPVQLIHRDIHFGNFLFHNGDFSGYIDFDLSQKNIRIFDLCYFLTGLLIKENHYRLTAEEWSNTLRTVVSGYESVVVLLPAEKEAVPVVMESIELLFAAYFVGLHERNHAENAAEIFRFVREQTGNIRQALK